MTPDDIAIWCGVALKVSGTITLSVGCFAVCFGIAMQAYKDFWRKGR